MRGAEDLGISQGVWCGPEALLRLRSLVSLKPGFETDAPEE